MIQKFGGVCTILLLKLVSKQDSLFSLGIVLLTRPFISKKLTLYWDINFVIYNQSCSAL